MSNAADISIFESVRLEFSKNKRKPTILLMLVLVAINCCYLVSSVKSFVDKPDAWKFALSYIPLTNTIFLSIIVAVLASRTMDIEHKGNTWKLLETLQSKKSIYFGKLAYGLVLLTFYALVQAISFVVIGKYYSFPGMPRLHDVILTSVDQLIAGMVVYLIQCCLSLIFTNQFAALCANLCGTFLGYFMMFINDKIILPWTLLFAIRFLDVPYSETNELQCIYTNVPVGNYVLCAVYFIAFIIIGWFLYGKVEEGGLHIGKTGELKNSSVQGNIPVEFVKIRRAPVWIAAIIVPIISAAIGTVNFVSCQGTLSFSWESLWTQHTLFLALFFLSVLTAIFCSYFWRLEHNGTNWNIILTLISPSKLVKNKLLVCSLFCAGSVAWAGILFILCGKIVGLPGLPPVRFMEYMLCGILGCISVCALHVFLSLFIRNFALPIGIALIGGLGGTYMNLAGMKLVSPYSLLSIGLSSNRPDTEINLPWFFAWSIGYILFFYLISTLYIKRTDAKTQE